MSGRDAVSVPSNEPVVNKNLGGDDQLDIIIGTLMEIQEKQELLGEQLEEIVEKLSNLSLPGLDFSIME